MAGNRSIFSRALRTALDAALAGGQQAMLFLNRRGAGIVVCRTCGEAVGCDRCDIPLTLHQYPAPPDGSRPPASALHCHECGFRAAPPRRCPDCGSERVRPMGMGTERLQAEVETAFPSARTLRWDRDTVRGRDGHRRLLERFRDGEATVLVGTQMIAKGLDLPQVTLVGVINADLSLRLPDYTGPERTFQLISQVAGRAGRAADPGHVVVQSYAPDHPPSSPPPRTTTTPSPPPNSTPAPPTTTPPPDASPASSTPTRIAPAPATSPPPWPPA